MVTPTHAKKHTINSNSRYTVGLTMSNVTTKTNTKER